MLTGELNGRLPPHDAEAEKALLGSILRDPPVLDAVAATVVAEDFYRDAHQRIYRALAEMAAAGRITIDLVSVYQWLEHAGHLADIGGPAYLAEIWEMVPTGANAEYYAATVRDTSLARQLIHVANEIAHGAYNRSAPALDQLATAERQLFELRGGGAGTGPRIARDLIREAIDRIEARYAARGQCGAELNGLSTDYPDLDQYLAGLRAGQVLVIGARPGGGKTALALNIAANVACAGVPTLFFSLEMPATEIADRLLSMGANVNLSRINRAALDPEHIQAIADQQKSSGAGALPLWVDDAAEQTADRIGAITRRAVRRHGVGLVVVDYLQLIQPENPRENRTQQVGLVARRLKLLARQCEIPLLCLCQLNRAVEARAGGKPGLADLRESGEIEQHADAVLLLNPAANQAPESEVHTIEVGVRKNRNGPTGELTLAYRRPVLRFENHSPGAG